MRDDPLRSKLHRRYLLFFFDRKPNFCEHDLKYSNGRGCQDFGNSARGLGPEFKRLLYGTCIQPFATYGFRRRHHNSAKAKASMQHTQAMRHKAACWISGAFRTAPRGAAESLAGLIPWNCICASWGSGLTLVHPLSRKITPSACFPAIIGPIETGTLPTVANGTLFFLPPLSSAHRRTNMSSGP